jgi:hypothetical protein
MMFNSPSPYPSPPSGTIRTWPVECGGEGTGLRDGWYILFPPARLTIHNHNTTWTSVCDAGKCGFQNDFTKSRLFVKLSEIDPSLSFHSERFIHMAIFSDNSESIGRTPLVRINRLTAGLKATVLAKIEGRNPAYSVKCRIGAAMIWDAERSGRLKPGMEVVEPTSGNTGIALAYVCALLVAIS